jgi:predicted glycosyltransferase
VLFYSHDGTGLGHLRISLGVAKELAARRPAASLLLLTGSLQAPAFDLPSNLDFVKLPAMPLRGLYADLSPAASPSVLRGVVYIREAIAFATVEAFAPHVVVVDHAPAGLFRELARALDWLRVASAPSRLILLMRDITFGPGQTRTIWTNEGIYPLLDNAYDRILVYGSKEIFDPVSEYGMSDRAAAKTRFCGYLAPAPARRSPGQVRSALGAKGRPLVAVSVGGGADGGPLLQAYLKGVARYAPSDLVSYVVAGPLLPEADRLAAEALAADLPGVTLVPFDPDYFAVAAAADVLVSMGGYNSLSESAYLGKRAVVAPRVPGPEEQIIRARRFEQLGLATTIAPEDLDSKLLWQAVLAELERAVPPTIRLSFAGTGTIVDEVIASMPDTARLVPATEG